MEIHNTMEDIVLKYLDEILSLKKDVCKCEHCKMDMICYALNRVKPMYMISSRGFIHVENKEREHRQEKIDVYAIIANAITVVSETRRHEVNHNYKDIDVESSQSTINHQSKSEYFYNFPQIIGRILDSSRLIPLSDVKIALFYETGRDIVPMYNARWLNPIDIVSQMGGTYTFWPGPIAAKKSGIQKDFYMNIEIKKNGFDPIHKFFFTRIISSNKLRRFIKKENVFYIDDIFLTPEGAEEI